MGFLTFLRIFKTQVLKGCPGKEQNLSFKGCPGKEQETAAAEHSQTCKDV